MIEHIVAAAELRPTYRLAGVPRTHQEALRELNISDPTTLLPILQASLPPDNAMRFLDAPFDPKEYYKGRTRFSDGSYPVYYSALERETTRAEMRYHNALRLLGLGSVPGALIFMREVMCTFEGMTKDLRQQVGNIPHLVGEESTGAYTTCNAIGAEARAEGIDGLLTPSARQLDGSCLPVFSRPALSNPALGSWVSFRHNPSTNGIESSEFA